MVVSALEEYCADCTSVHIIRVWHMRYQLKLNQCLKFFVSFSLVKFYVSE